MADITPSNSNSSNSNDIPLQGSGPYDLQYYSGNQAQIYIGDVLIDEVTSFHYSVRQSKAPVYGYASQLFDAVAPGQVLVQGSFSVNFVESGYLWLILNRYKSFQNNLDKALNRIPGLKNVSPSSVLSSKGTKVSGGSNIPYSRITNNNKSLDFISQANIKKLINGQSSTDERFEIYKNIAYYATINQPSDVNSAYQQIVNVFEDEVWQEDIADVDLLARRVDDNFFDDFDMFVIFGDFTKQGTSHTVRRIRNVHLLGQAQSIELGGEPLQESYEFFARNII